MSEAQSMESMVCGLQDGCCNAGGEIVSGGTFDEAECDQLSNISWQQESVQIEFSELDGPRGRLLEQPGVYGAYLHPKGEGRVMRVLCDTGTDVRSVLESSGFTVESLEESEVV
ncbi:MAG: hypothetical protein ABIA92_04455 [Patescibacteria group bacterium]